MIDLAPTAAALGCETVALRAVVKVESGGRGINPDGRPVIRLEAHHLWKHADTADKAAVDTRFRVLPQADGSKKPWLGHEFLIESGVAANSGSEWRKMHTGQTLEWTAYMVAQEIDPDAAMRATSWGAGQILGVYERLGYGTGAEGRAAFRAAQNSEAGQVDCLARFIKADPLLVTALRTRDWSGFARRYNGSGQVAKYAKRLEAAYRAG